MDFEIKDAEVTRAYEVTRGNYTDYCLNVKWQDGSYPNALTLKAKTADVFAGIKQGDRIKSVRGFINGRAWAGNAEKGEMVFVDFKVTRRESVELEAPAAASAGAVTTATFADIIKVWALKHGISADQATADWNTATSELTKCWKTIFPAKKRNQLTPEDMAVVVNAITGASAEQQAAEDPATDFPF